MAKLEVSEFIQQSLENFGCKAVRVHKDSITAQCPYHFNRSNFSTFRVSTVEVYNKNNGIRGYYYHCFSCGAGGSIVSLVAHLYKCSIKKALRIFEKSTVLREITLASISKDLDKLSHQDEYGVYKEVVLPPSARDNDPMYKYLNRRNRTYHGTLDIDYIVNKYELYYCSSGRYSGRIIMPVRDVNGRVIYFNDRTIIDDAKQKSLHEKGSIATEILHGINHAYMKKDAVLVEGAFDMFAVDCALRGTERTKRLGVVCSMGVLLTEARMAVLLKYFDKLYLMYDNDKTGIKATIKIMKEFSEDMKVVECTRAYPEGKDPGKCTKAEIRKAIAHPHKGKWLSNLEYTMRKSGFSI